MTDFEKKLEEVKKNNNPEDFETYESINDEKIIVVYESCWTFTEYVYTKEGKYIEKNNYEPDPF